MWWPSQDQHASEYKPLTIISVIKTIAWDIEFGPCLRGMDQILWRSMSIEPLLNKIKLHKIIRSRPYMLQLNKWKLWTLVVSYWYTDRVITYNLKHSNMLKTSFKHRLIRLIIVKQRILKLPKNEKMTDQIYALIRALGCSNANLLL